MKLDPYLTPYTKINSKWIKDLNIKPETKTTRKKKYWKSSMILVWVEIFEYDLKSTAYKSKNKQIKLHQAKNFCTVKKTTNRMKGQLIE